jgi:hypothetical protein
MPAVNSENDEDEEIRGEDEGFSGRHFLAEKTSNGTIIYITVRVAKRQQNGRFPR